MLLDYMHLFFIPVDVTIPKGVCVTSRAFLVHLEQSEELRNALNALERRAGQLNLSSASGEEFGLAENALQEACCHCQTILESGKGHKQQKCFYKVLISIKMIFDMCKKSIANRSPLSSDPTLMKISRHFNLGKHCDKKFVLHRLRRR